MVDINELDKKILTAPTNRRSDRHSMQVFEKKGDGYKGLEVYPRVDMLTVVGTVPTKKLKKFETLVNTNAYFNVLDGGGPQAIKAKSVDDKVFIEFVGLRKNQLRAQFNPNKMNREERRNLIENVLKFIPEYHFSRLDLAIDLNVNLSEYFIYSDVATKTTVHSGLTGQMETKYIGTRSSDKFIRIYNKKQEVNDKQDFKDDFFLSEVDQKFYDGQHWWRVEVELKRSRTDDWKHSFDQLHLVKPNWKNIEKNTDRAMVFMLLNDNTEWANLEYRTRKKYKKMISEISDVDLNEVLKEVVRVYEKDLQDELNYWIVL